MLLDCWSDLIPSGLLRLLPVVHVDVYCEWQQGTSNTSAADNGTTEKSDQSLED